MNVDTALCMQKGVESFSHKTRFNYLMKVLLYRNIGSLTLLLESCTYMYVPFYLKPTHFISILWSSRWYGRRAVCWWNISLVICFFYIYFRDYMYSGWGAVNIFYMYIGDVIIGSSLACFRSGMEDSRLTMLTALFWATLGDAGLSVLSPDLLTMTCTGSEWSCILKNNVRQTPIIIWGCILWAFS